VSSILVTIQHCSALSGDSSSHRSRYSCGTFRRLLVLSAFWGVLGNALHAVAVDKGSIPLAVVGRFVFGFSSAEILQRQLLAACHPSNIVSESARLIYLRVAGVVVGLFIGALVESIPMVTESLGVRSVQSTSWLLMVLWLVHFVRLVVQFRSTDPNVAAQSVQPKNDYITGILPVMSGESVGSSTDSDALNESNADLSATYGTVTSANDKHDPQNSPGAPPGTSEAMPLRTSEVMSLRRKPATDQGGKKSGFRQFRVFAIRIRKLLEYHVGIPVSFLSLLFATFAIEVFFTGTPIITSRYFGWSGARACLFLGCLALSILPIHFFCEHVSRRYEERTVVKVCPTCHSLLVHALRGLYSNTSLVPFSALFSSPCSVSC
jgi:hypothetical protein